MQTKYLKSYGYGKIYTQDGPERHSTDATWDVDYDGKDMDIEISIDEDGEKKSFQQTLDNEDLDAIFKHGTSQIPIHERLTRDYLIDQRVYEIVPVKLQKNTSKKKKIGKPIKSTHNDKSSSRKSTKQTLREKSHFKTPRPQTKRIHLSHKKTSKKTSKKSSKKTSKKNTKRTSKKTS